MNEVAARSWDALVVGAGPAGSVAARELARLGLSVLLVDRATFPRRKVCGCCLNGATLASLREAGLGDVPGRFGAVPLTRVKLAAGGRAAELELPSGMALSREAFDAALIDEAVAAGAQFLGGTAVKRTAAKWAACNTSDQSESVIRCRVVVAADGLNGQLTASDDNRPQVREASRIGGGAIAADADGYEPGTIHMATGTGGYVGLVRLEDGRLDVAAAFDSGFVRSAGGLGHSAETILREAGLPPVPGLADLGWRGTPPLTRTPRRRAGPGWFAIGDAAGYVEPFTGEGMAWAIASAAAVAPIAAKAARATQWNPAWEAEWEAAYARVVRSRQDLCRTAARVLRSPTLTRLTVRLLSFAPGLAGPVLTRLNRPARPIPLAPEFAA